MSIRLCCQEGQRNHQYSRLPAGVKADAFPWMPLRPAGFTTVRRKRKILSGHRDGDDLAAIPARKPVHSENVEKINSGTFLPTRLGSGRAARAVRYHENGDAQC
jgi:hypothetical protein